MSTYLPAASDARKKSAEFDLTPALNSVADEIIKAAEQGMYTATVAVPKDSIYVKHMARILTTLGSYGYVATFSNGVVFVEWTE